MKIIITIPAYNEERTIGKIIEEINLVMKNTHYDYEILVVNDGSTDRTAEIAKAKGAIVHSHPYNLGLMKTFQTEIQKCLELKADVIVHTDADGQFFARDIPRLIQKIEQGYDLVIGSRFYNKIKHMPLMKRIGNKAFAKVFSTITKKRLTDTTSGFRAFNNKVAENLKFINTFTYTQEQIIRAIKSGFKIVEIPIETRRTRPSRLFKSPFNYAIRAWINIFRIYRDYDPIKFFGKIGLFFFLIGFIIGLYFVYLHFTTGITGHLGLLFLMLILLFTGFQTILFGLLADMMKR